MPEYALVWDIETVPDISMIGRVNGHPQMTVKQAREVLRGVFPKLPWHKIICIGALIASRAAPDRGWEVESIGAPHINERSEPELIVSFADRIGSLRPKLVTYNGYSFDLPVIRLRAMFHGVNASGLNVRPYFSRFGDDAIDLCDVLASFSPQSKIGLDDLCRSFGIPGKIAGMSGAEVENNFYQGRIADIADYCMADVVATYRIWLRHELFRGQLTREGWEASEMTLDNFLQSRSGLRAIPK